MSKNKMQKLKHIKFAGELMTISWLLLFGFVAQWLISRYGSEKEILVKELDRQFSETKLQVIDSTLILNLIDPMLEDTGQAGLWDLYNKGATHFRTIDKCDTLVVSSQTCGKKGQVLRINITDSCSGQMPGIIRKYRFHDDSGKTALHSIRLIVAQSIDSGGSKSVFKQILPNTTDTVLFRKLFLDKMKKQGLHFGIAWSSGVPKDSHGRKNSQIYLTSKIFDQPVEAKIGKFSWYLIGRIIPQLLFAFVLLLLTGGSFIFTYRSLKKQLLLNELRNDFISNITHELKTPVATVKVALESLRNFDMKRDPAVANDYLNMVFLEMDRLDKLIGKVLNISVLEDKQHMVTLRSADLKALTEKVVRSMDQRIGLLQGAITLEAPDEKYDCLMDELFIEGVLFNLIDNSLKYAIGKPFIRILLTQDESMVTLAVSDHGPGIPEPYLTKVFEKFFRVPSGDVHNVKGHGLGLSYAAQVMKQHNGTIRAKNLEQGGCELSLTIPKR